MAFAPMASSVGVSAVGSRSQLPQPPPSIPASSDTEMTTDSQTATNQGLDSVSPAAAPSAQSAANPDPAQPLDPNNPNAQRIIKRRAPVACRRCRRMRSKCIHNGAKPPCQGCAAAGVPLDECVFPMRGAPDFDREYRHPRMKGDKARKETATRQQVFSHRAQNSGGSGASASPGAIAGGHIDHPMGFPGPAVPADAWDLLPPLNQIIEAVEMFTRQYFQLGFIPRQAFVQQLREQPQSVSPFMLLGVLSVSARMTPSLVAAHGGALATAELYMDRASKVAQAELYQEPTLARCQAFYLLNLAQQGSGYRNPSFVNLGIALRMAILMRLHREDTYDLGQNGRAAGKPGSNDKTPTAAATPGMIQKAESARRTLWMLYSQDNLHAAPSAPVSLAASDISLLLPCDEEDFNNGVLPKTRAALEDTPPARRDPSLVSMPGRSLFATLMQSHQLWGRILRGAIWQEKGKGNGFSAGDHPRDPKSEYATISAKLKAWEDNLPPNHLWSKDLMRMYKTEGCDLAYIAITMVTRLCNIVIRRAYLSRMLSKSGSAQDRAFFEKMSGELFYNVRGLYVQIDYWNQVREPDDSTGAQLAIFCVYLCALMAAYLDKYPTLCPDKSITDEGKKMLDRTMDILHKSTSVWPLAQRWIDSVEKVRDTNQSVLLVSIAPGSHEGGMAEGKDPIPSALHPAPTYSAPMGPSNTPFDDRRQRARQFGPNSNSPHTRSASPGMNNGLFSASGAGGNGSSLVHPGGSNGVNGLGINGHGPSARYQPPPHMLLPPPHPPQPSPSMASAAAASSTLYAPTSAVSVPPNGVSTPTHQQAPLHHQISPHNIAAGMPNGSISPSLSGPLPGVGAATSMISPTVPQQRTLLPDGRVGIVVPGFSGADDSSASSNFKANTAAVLDGILPHDGYPQSQQPPQPPQPQPQHHPFAQLDMSMMGQANPAALYGDGGIMPDFRDLTVLPDDGFQNNLQMFMHGPGPGVQATTAWDSFI